MKVDVPATPEVVEAPKEAIPTKRDDEKIETTEPEKA